MLYQIDQALERQIEIDEFVREYLEANFRPPAGILTVVNRSFLRPLGNDASSASRVNRSLVGHLDNDRSSGSR